MRIVDVISVYVARQNGGIRSELPIAKAWKATDNKASINGHVVFHSKGDMVVPPIDSSYGSGLVATSSHPNLIAGALKAAQLIAIAGLVLVSIVHT